MDTIFSAVVENPHSGITSSTSDVKARGVIWEAKVNVIKHVLIAQGGKKTRSQRLNIKTALLLIEFVFGACYCISFKFKMPEIEAECDPYMPRFIFTVLRSVLVYRIF